MSDPLRESPAAGLPPAASLAPHAKCTPPTQGWMPRLLPFLPIVVALASALVIRQWPSRAFPPRTTDLIGTLAPDFSLTDAQSADDRPPVTLSGLVRNGPVVLIFHRGLTCPVCAQHLAEFTATAAAFKSAGVQVVAVSTETPQQTRDALFSYGTIGFPLLWDPDGSVDRAYGLATPEGWFLDGTFVIDTHRRFLFAASSNEPVGNAAELLNLASKNRSPMNDAPRGQQEP